MEHDNLDGFLRLIKVWRQLAIKDVTLTNPCFTHNVTPRKIVEPLEVGVTYALFGVFGYTTFMIRLD